MALAGGLPSAIYILLVFATFPSFSSATETLRSGNTLTGNATLVSAGGLFEFGFFRPAGGSAEPVYLGIWYYSITPRVVVWIANRDAPFADTSAQVQLAGDGNLIVLLENGNGTQGWSTGLPSRWGSNSTATLRDDGNLVIRRDGGAGPETWRSFEFPTDTLLPGMKISLDRNTGNGTQFRSWRSSAAPAGGNYTLGLDPRGALQLVIVHQPSGLTRWRSGLWNRDSFSGVDRMRPLLEYGFHLTADPDETAKLILSFTYMNNTKMRFVLLPNGTEITYVYEAGQWKNVWQQPITECELFNHCGENAFCDETAEPKCSCFSGFEPRSVSEWGRGNWTRGCLRRTPLKAQRKETGGGGEDGFLRLQWMKLPDAAELNLLARDADGCAANCAGNLSCTAYGLLEGGECLRWTGDLVDVFRFADENNGGDLFLRLAASEFDIHKKEPNKAVIIASTVLGTILLLLLILMSLRYKSRIRAMWKKRGRVDNAATEAATSGEQLEYMAMIGTGSSNGFPREQKPFELPMFSFEIIEAATENFSEANELGKGGFGYVYKGKLPWGEEIAVKRLSRNSGQGEEEFKNEMTVIAKLQHVNLVRLLGCCVRGEEKMLIYEYMPNKSLDAFIFDREKQQLLNWRARFNIIEGVARGLLYLHRDSRLRIVHRDLKASNILLDRDMNPKISDFGMARIFCSNQNDENTVHVVGTFGYMSPEYAMEGLFSVKSDVYSFGVLLLEIITGKKNTRCRSEEYHNLLGYAWKMWEAGRGMELVDPSASESCSPEEVLRCIQVALLCVQDRANDRPTMSSVVIMLSTATEILTRPMRPTFANVAGSPARIPIDEGSSENNVTITMLDGR